MQSKKERDRLSSVHCRSRVSPSCCLSCLIIWYPIGVVRYLGDLCLGLLPGGEVLEVAKGMMRDGHTVFAEHGPLHTNPDGSSPC